MKILTNLVYFKMVTAVETAQNCASSQYAVGYTWSFFQIFWKTLQVLLYVICLNDIDLVPNKEGFYELSI